MARRVNNQDSASIFDLTNNSKFKERNKRRTKRLQKSLERTPATPQVPKSATDLSQVHRWGNQRLLQYVRALGPIHGVRVWMDSPVVEINLQKPNAARLADFKQFLTVLGEIGKNREIPHFARFFELWFTSWDQVATQFPGLDKAIEIGFQPKYWAKIFADDRVSERKRSGLDIYNWIIRQGRVENAVEEEPNSSQGFQIGDASAFLD